MKLFAWNPIAGFIVATAFAALCFIPRYTTRSKRIIGTAAFIWFLYGCWETYITGWRSPTGDMAIRVDLVLFSPVLVLTAFLGIITAIRGHKNTS